MWSEGNFLPRFVLELIAFFRLSFVPSSSAGAVCSSGPDIPQGKSSAMA